MRAYGTHKTHPSRMARKRLRRDVFLANKKAAHIRKKAARLERKSLALLEEVE